MMTRNGCGTDGWHCIFQLSTYETIIRFNPECHSPQNVLVDCVSPASWNSRWPGKCQARLILKFAHVGLHSAVFPVQSRKRTRAAEIGRREPVRTQPDTEPGHTTQ